MEKILTLNKAIKINGKEVKELKYDISAITGEQFLEADAYAAAKAAALGKPNVKVAETDDSLQYYLGIMAIIAVNDEIDVADLERISGVDIMQLYRIGRVFTKGSAEEEDMEEPGSEENSSEGQSEDMQEPTIPESGN